MVELVARQDLSGLGPYQVIRESAFGVALLLSGRRDALELAGAGGPVQPAAPATGSDPQSA